jgi:hypothetical protein
MTKRINNYEHFMFLLYCLTIKLLFKEIFIKNLNVEPELFI